MPHGILLRQCVATRSLRRAADVLPCWQQHCRPRQQRHDLNQRASVHAQASSPSFVDHYQVLGVSPKATQAQIKSAFYTLSLRYHPDKDPTDDAAEKYSRIRDAYEVLSDVATRRRFDLSLGVGRASNAGAVPSPGASGPSFRGRRASGPLNYANAQFDFDAFYREHYGQAARWKAQKERDRRARKEAQELANAGPGWPSFALLAAFITAFLAGPTGGGML